MPANSKPLPFSANPILRATAEHHDPAWIEAQLANPAARYLPLRKLEALVLDEDPPRLAWLDARLLASATAETEAILLGTLDGIPHFAVAVDELPPELEAGKRFLDARTLATLLAAPEASIVGQARALVDWHARHRFCAQCGGPTQHIEGGARRRCTVCDARHYPRVDPSVIMLVEHEGRALLARRATAPGNRRSCLAGFIEPGESIEEAVTREVFEEAGVQVVDVRYLYSQPWPFPSSLMIGCRATALSDAVTVDGVEIASAEWFDRAEGRAAIEERSAILEVPGAITIAHHLIRDWAYEQ